MTNKSSYAFMFNLSSKCNVMRSYYSPLFKTKYFWSGKVLRKCGTINIFLTECMCSSRMTSRSLKHVLIFSIKALLIKTGLSIEIKVTTLVANQIYHKDLCGLYLVWREEEHVFSPHCCMEVTAHTMFNRELSHRKPVWWV